MTVWGDSGPAQRPRTGRRFNLKAGDKLEVMMSASNPAAKICIEAIRPKGEPLVPAIVFSMIE